jgi:hypothetical protein
MTSWLLRLICKRRPAGKHPPDVTHNTRDRTHTCWPHLFPLPYFNPERHFDIWVIGPRSKQLWSYCSQRAGHSGSPRKNGLLIFKQFKEIWRSGLGMVFLKADVTVLPNVTYGTWNSNHIPLQFLDLHRRTLSLQQKYERVAVQSLICRQNKRRQEKRKLRAAQWSRRSCKSASFITELKMVSERNI